MTIATFLGIMFTSIFVVCVQKFLIFDESQEKAYLMLARCYYKEIMKVNALSFFTIQYKTKLLYKERYEYRDRQYRSYDLFYYEKMKAEYLY